MMYSVDPYYLLINTYQFCTSGSNQPNFWDSYSGCLCRLSACFNFAETWSILILHQQDCARGEWFGWGRNVAFQKIRRQATKRSRFLRSCNMLSFALLTVRQGVEMGMLSRHTLSVEQSSPTNARGRCVPCLGKILLWSSVSHFTFSF